jgi:hypothetical protein
LGPLPFTFLALTLWGAVEPGIYVWDGIRSEVGLEKSAGLSAQAGFRAIRLILSPVSRRTYGLMGERAATLSGLFGGEAIQSVLKHRELKTVMLTAYDFASYSDQHYLDRGFLAANRQSVFDEYEQLTEEIMRRESGSGRTFVIGHWEGDNQVYCGSSYKYLVNDAERTKCQSQNPAERLAGLTEWLRIRQEAIAMGRDRAKKAGATGVEVLHAVEFNSLFHFRSVAGADIRQKDYHGVLDTVVPRVKPDLCSYSAWESLNPDRVGKDLKLILKECAPARLIIGELGYEPGGEHKDPTKDYLKAIAAISKFRGGVTAVYFWEAFQKGFGIFGSDGQAAWPGTLAAMTSLK